MTINEKKEFAKYTKEYVISFFRELDNQLLEVGPDEILTEFLCYFGYIWSDFIMKDIVPTGIFSQEELAILNKIELYFYKLLSNHSKATSWNNLRKEEYLKIKSMTHEYLTLVYDLNHY